MKARDNSFSSDNDSRTVSSHHSSVYDSDSELYRQDGEVVYDTQSNLTEKNVRLLKYKNYIENLPPISYPYWQHHQRAVDSYKNNDINRSIEEITEAMRLVMQNANITANRIYKVMVIYHYLQFADTTKFYNTIKFRAYMPEVLTVAEALQDQKVLDKTLSVMSMGFSNISLDDGYKKEDLSKKLPDELSSKQEEILSKLDIEDVNSNTVIAKYEDNFRPSLDDVKLSGEHFSLKPNDFVATNSVDDF